MQSINRYGHTAQKHHSPGYKNQKELPFFDAAGYQVRLFHFQKVTCIAPRSAGTI